MLQCSKESETKGGNAQSQLNRQVLYSNHLPTYHWKLVDKHQTRIVVAYSYFSPIIIFIVNDISIEKTMTISGSVISVSPLLDYKSSMGLRERLNRQ